MSRPHSTFNRCHPEPKAKYPRIAGRRGTFAQGLACFCLAIFLLFACAMPAHAQGCAQCLDSTRATPPQVQAAYRHAIYLLGGTGTLLFIVGAVILRRER